MRTQAAEASTGMGAHFEDGCQMPDTVFKQSCVSEGREGARPTARLRRRRAQLFSETDFPAGWLPRRRGAAAANSDTDGLCGTARLRGFHLPNRTWGHLAVASSSTVEKPSPWGRGYILGNMLNSMPKLQNAS